MLSGISSSSYATQDLSAMREKRFKKADADGDGKLTKDELSSTISQNGKGPSVDEIFSKIDTNQDGSIDDSEDQAASEAMQKNRPSGPPPDASEMASKLFKAADADEDGSITQSELTSALSDDSGSLNVEDLFKQTDTDEDGAISKSELEASLKKMMEQMMAKNEPPPTDTTSTGYDKSGNGMDDTVQSSFSAIA